MASSRDQHVSLKQHEGRISVPEHESHTLQKCKVRIQHDTRVSNPKLESLVLPVSECDSHISDPKRLRVSDPKCEIRVLRQAQPTMEDRISTPHEVHVSIKKRETRIQNGMSSRHKKPKSSHPQGFEASSSDVLETYLRDYLIRKMSVHQIIPQCHCERLISAVLSDYHCGFQITKFSIFNRFLAASKKPKDNSPGRRNHSPTSSTKK